jgi:flagellar assembly protein FliH
LTLTIAEKIVCIALDSSGEVVKRMILGAAAPAEAAQWAKVTISDKDVEMMKEDGIDI